MKFNYFIIIFAILSLGCKEGAKQGNVISEATNTEQSNESSKPTNSGLTQNGDYSSLFNSPDCKVITAEEISSALGRTIIDMNLNGMCSFKSEWPTNKVWYLSILRNDMSKSDIQREIQNFESDETGRLTLQMSETDDTYFCIQHSNGYLSIYNPNYDGSVLIRYGSVAESRSFTKEEREEQRGLAAKLANALLKKHQK